MKTRSRGVSFTASALGVILWVILVLALLYRFLRHDAGGTLLCLFFFLGFFALFNLCFSRGFNLGKLLPEAWGRVLCGLFAAFLLYFAYTAEGSAKDAFIALGIILTVMALIYPLFTLSSDSPVKRKTSSQPLPPKHSEPAPQKRKAKPKRGKRS